MFANPPRAAIKPAARAGKLVTLATLAFAMLAVLPAGAKAFVYWSNYSQGAIGRASLDGTGVNQSFISGASAPEGVAVDAGHVYWANGADSLGRANLDGTGVNQSFISAADAIQPYGVAVDAGHVYWGYTHSIGRAGLDGTSVIRDLISGVNPPDALTPLGVAVDAGHIYWANIGSDTIGRANLDGTGVELNFITTAGVTDPFGFPTGVAVDGGHIYWANVSARNANTIGRANLDGTGVDQNFVSGLGISGADGVAADGGHIYWANNNFNTIGRANLDGTGVNQSFISGASNPTYVAVDGLGPTAAETVTLAPSTAVNVVGTSHAITATVDDAASQPVSGTAVRFSMSGSVSTTGSCTTAADGTCTFTYTGPEFPGADQINAYADTNANAIQDPGEPAATPATKLWILPASTGGHVTGGGQVANAAGSGKVAFGFTAKSDEKGLKGNCSLVDHSTRTKLKCSNVTAISVSGTRATLYGDAVINRHPTTYKITVNDAGEPGIGRDTFTIHTASGYQVGGLLKAGNVQVH